MIEDDVTRAVGLVLAPQFSALSVAKYQQRVADGLELYRGTHRVPARVELPRRRRADRRLRRRGWSRGSRAGRTTSATASTSSSRRTAFPSACSRTAIPTACSASRPRGSWRSARGSRPSAGRGATSPPGARPSPGRAPTCGEHLAELAARGIRDVVVVPVGFVSDHVEILFDIDVRARARADELGMRLERPPALNDDPVFIGALAELVRGRAA